MALFAFGLQAVLDERVRAEDRARAAFSYARQEEFRAQRALADAASHVHDPSAVVLLELRERAGIARRRSVENKCAAARSARDAFERARYARLQLTTLRERAYRRFSQEKTLRESRELDEANRSRLAPGRRVG